MPEVSVILPLPVVPADTDRAVESVLSQTFSDWELFVIGNFLDEQAYALARHSSELGFRARAIQVDADLSASEIKNICIEASSGHVITYIGPHEEYYPNHLQNVARLASEADVVLFAYDFLYEGEKGECQLATWDPSQYRDLLFMKYPALPLSVVHRRSVWQRVSGATMSCFGKGKTGIS